MLSNEIYNKILLFIPIIVITFLILSPNEIITFLHTILGKLLSIVLIIFYSCKDLIYGVLCALIIIVLYQSQIYENMLELG